MNLLSHVVNIIQFKYNQAKLEELDDETMDSDVSSDSFLKFHNVTCFFPRIKLSGNTIFVST